MMMRLGRRRLTLACVTACGCLGITLLGVLLAAAHRGKMWQENDLVACRSVASLGPPGLLNPVPARRARLLLAQGDLAGAARWTTECGLGADD